MSVLTSNEYNLNLHFPQKRKDWSFFSFSGMKKEALRIMAVSYHNINKFSMTVSTNEREKFVKRHNHKTIAANILFPSTKSGIKSQLLLEKWEKKSPPSCHPSHRLDFETNFPPGASGTISTLKMSQMMEILLSYYLLSMLSRSITYWIYCLSLVRKC